MTKPVSTRDRLRIAARGLFWARGYSNVSLREVAAEARADVALVARHFGGKEGLFEATLEDAFDTGGLPGWSVDELIEAVVRLFVEAPRDGSPSVLRMVQMNADDAAVGETVRARWANTFQRHIEGAIGDTGDAVLFTAALFGFAMAEKSLRLDGIAVPGSRGYADQLRRLLRAAVG